MILQGKYLSKGTGDGTHMNPILRDFRSFSPEQKVSPFKKPKRKSNKSYPSTPWFQPPKGYVLLPAEMSGMVQETNRNEPKTESRRRTLAPNRDDPYLEFQLDN